MRGSKTSNYSSIKLTDEQKIENRPVEINGRKLEGHWERDLIVGSKNQSCVGTLVERKTGYLILSKMKVYFADPYSPWQRGSNENINGVALASLT